MDDFWRDYWWLLFPIGAFVFGAWDRWLAYKRSRDHLDLLRSYAEKGQGAAAGARARRRRRHERRGPRRLWSRRPAL